MDYKTELREYIELLIDQEGSDIHLLPNVVPSIRVFRKLISIPNKKELSDEDMNNFLSELLTAEQLEKLSIQKFLQFSHTHTIDQTSARFRGSAYFTKGSIAINLRYISTFIPRLEEISLPSVLRDVVGRSQGFFLVVGPVGHGKTTTIFSMLEDTNQSHSRHIMTIEDPIEYILSSKKSIITQREVPTDVKNFEDGLNTALRADVDVMMVGEMRTKETITTAIRASETGHLVLSTLHTNGAADTINRIVGSFPHNDKEQIREQLSYSLLGIFSIRLVTRVGGGLVPAYEVLLNNPAIANIIRENRLSDISSIIQSHLHEGMIQLDQSLANLVKEGEISNEMALQMATDSKSLGYFLS
ncbi:MAG: PilT/PilU family type 4a pilus ATPase [Candidatus Campbellbacteria bacterium]|nr:PilT/PilU family type 4a pilus ATPase [Candidatus Campbellbacteria bacterium]